MAKIVGAIGVSHIPAIGKAIAENRQKEAYWRPFFDGLRPAQEWLAEVRPDVAVMIYNDHGLNFFLDKMPTFAMGAADLYRSADEGWGLPVLNPFAGDAELSWFLIDRLINDEFDLTTCQEMLVDHAFCVPTQLLWPSGLPSGLKFVPLSINTVQHPLPSAKRCLALGRALGRAIREYPKDARVVIVGTGGLSHQLDGKRAGFINKQFDLDSLNSLVNDPDALSALSTHDLVEQAGTQGVELLMWIAMRGALGEKVSKVHAHYHIPISNTAAASLVLAPRDLQPA